jgi:hypothetical protein
LSSDGTHRVDVVTKQVVPNKKIWCTRGVYIPLGACVESKVKELFPNEEGIAYTGLQAGDERC